MKWRRCTAGWGSSRLAACGHLRLGEQHAGRDGCYEISGRVHLTLPGGCLWPRCSAAGRRREEGFCSVREWNGNYSRRYLSRHLFDLIQLCLDDCRGIVELDLVDIHVPHPPPPQCVVSPPSFAPRSFASWKSVLRLAVLFQKLVQKWFLVQLRSQKWFLVLAGRNRGTLRLAEGSGPCSRQK